jgi:hypothetical protein
MIFGVAALAANLMSGSAADAGCGCDKPPPPSTSIRPAFASPGDVVTLFGSKIKVGRLYRVRFQSSNDSNVYALGVLKRDLADGVSKPMIEVATPAVGTGPTRVRVFDFDGREIVDVDDDDFTVMEAPLKLNENDQETVVSCFRAAVSGDNTVLIPVDITNIAEHMIFQGVADDYPLLFDADDIAIYNTQGFLMQLLGPQQAGIYAITDPGQPGSLALTYDRHEFVTYQIDHAHVGGLGLDQADPRWHLDGTYHVDHNRLVIAIDGVVENQGAPAERTTPRFTFRVTTALAEEDGAAPTTRTLVWSNACGGGN